MLGLAAMWENLAHLGLCVPTKHMNYWQIPPSSYIY